MIVAAHTGFEHPADLAPIGEGDFGYARQTVSFCVVIGPAGQFVAVEKLVSFNPSEKSGVRMMLPETLVQRDGVSVNFLWDQRRDALGAAGTRGHSRWLVDERARFEANRASHRAALEGVKDTPLVAFLKFLDEWGPELILEAPGWENRGDATFVFRFQYDDEFLHERHAAQLAWSRVQSARFDTGQSGQRRRASRRST